MSDTPLVWTIYGNLPMAELEYRTAWHFAPSSVTFVETYLRGDEVVKQSVHVHALNTEGNGNG